MIAVGQKEINCFLCKFYRPDETREFQGNCCRYFPRAGDNTGPGEPGMEWAFIIEPVNTWCGDFENWTGTPRPQGLCPYVPPQADAAEVDGATEASADIQATKAAATTKAATTKAATTNKKGGK